MCLSLTCLAFISHVKHESVCQENNTFMYGVMFECLKNKEAFKNICVEVNKNVLVICCCFLCVSFVLHLTWLLLLQNFCFLARCLIFPSSINLPIVKVVEFMLCRSIPHNFSSLC